jgi:hypothetical protein
VKTLVGQSFIKISGKLGAIPMSQPACLLAAIRASGIASIDVATHHDSHIHLNMAKSSAAAKPSGAAK